MAGKFLIKELTDKDVEVLEEKLDTYDREHVTYKLNGEVSIGIKDGDKLIAGAYGCMTDFKILYVETVYVDEEYRRQGVGKRLIEEVERRARGLQANIIRLDTYNWQGRDFYKAIGFEEVGSYESKEDGFSEHFFLKRL
ncbi:GNAT family N-acetyltransferase [Clostridium hydrogenum]|uniref:GNAT family N-acetyltransferase n=1 Tax=Clostridium hydrogenum TaxID=2855764 RepID=UPI001F43D96F|nr:GNAT family N-acetyltransferase [Clostridium hydrogenum]